MIPGRHYGGDTGLHVAEIVLLPEQTVCCDRSRNHATAGAALRPNRGKNEGCVRRHSIFRYDGNGGIVVEAVSKAIQHADLGMKNNNL
jgi:hypothetical protein